MANQDKMLQCCDCGTSFAFTANEQEFYRSKGFSNEPKRCVPCRQVRKERQGNDGYRTAAPTYRTERSMFPATCAACGQQTEVPFEPRQGRPVYCSNCYRSVKVTR